MKYINSHHISVIAANCQIWRQFNIPASYEMPSYHASRLQHIISERLRQWINLTYHSSRITDLSTPSGCPTQLTVAYTQIFPPYANFTAW